MAAEFNPYLAVFYCAGRHEGGDIPSTTAYTSRMVTPGGSATLPVPLTPLIGRDAELTAACDLLRRAGVRLVTLTGAGGTGKTRLALALATRVAHYFPDGVAFVDLSSLRDPELVASVIATALGVRETAGRPLTVALMAHLRCQHLLLILDNFEQVISASPLVRDLLAAAPELHILVTSRVALRISGEHMYNVPPLVTPDPTLRLPLEELAATPAVALFLERARAVRHSFALTERNAPAVAHVCARLDGLPLALELASAWTRFLSAEQLAARLEDRFRLLTNGDRTALPRQQSLRATIDWSYDLLPEPERALLRRLAVFAGGWTLVAAEAVCMGQGIDAADVLDRLAALVAHSLVVARDDGDGGEVRYRMLETIREYALERLAASGEAEAFRHRHAQLSLRMAEDAEPYLKRVDRDRWVARLETENENFRTALAWLLMTGEAETSLRLAAALVPFWSERGHLSEGRGWLQRALNPGSANLPPWLRAKGLSGAGMLAMLQGDAQAARALLDEGLAHWRAVGNTQGAADTLGMLAHAVHLEGDIPAMVALAEKSLALYRQLNDRQGIAGALGQVGHAAWHQQAMSRAWALLTEALALLRDLEHRPALWNPFMSITHVLWTLGNVARDLGDHAGARSLYAEGMAAARKQGSAFHVAILLDSLASLDAVAGQAIRAARLLGAAEAVRSASGVTLAPIYRRDFYDAIVARVQAALNAGTLTAAWAEGRALTWEQAIAYGLADVADPVALPHPSSEGRRLEGDGGPVYPDHLTAREVEVLRLLAGGKSNAAIAGELVLSRYTIERHVANIYAKIGVHTRVDATAYALQHNLGEPR